MILTVLSLLSVPFMNYGTPPAPFELSLAEPIRPTVNFVYNANCPNSDKYSLLFYQYKNGSVNLVSVTINGKLIEMDKEISKLNDRLKDVDGNVALSSSCNGSGIIIEIDGYRDEKSKNKYVVFAIDRETILGIRHGAL